jgi:hypothetical protein
MAQLLQYRSASAHLPTMLTHLPLDPDTITVASAASSFALSDLAATLATGQAATAASCEHAAVVEAASQ